MTNCSDGNFNCQSDGMSDQLLKMVSISLNFTLSFDKPRSGTWGDLPSKTPSGKCLRNFSTEGAIQEVIDGDGDINNGDNTSLVQFSKFVECFLFRTLVISH